MMSERTTPAEQRAAHLASGAWDAVTLAGRVAEWAHRRPHDVAITSDTDDEPVTYAALDRDASTLAAHLGTVGVGQGDVVSIQLPNGAAAAIAAVAVLRLGAVVNPLLPNYRQRELAHVFATASPRAILTPAVRNGFDHRELVEAVSTTTGVAPHHVVVDTEAGGGHATLREVLAAAEPPAPTFPEPPADAPSEIIFTSGTEAQPKAILHTEQTAGFSVRAARHHLGLGDHEVVWMPSPVGHSTGFNYGLRFALHHGFPLVLQDRWDAAVAARLIERHGCTYTLAATTFLQDLVEHLRQVGRKLDGFTHFGCGGAPVPPELVRAAEEVGIGVLRLYGSTEVLVATWNRPDAPAERRAHTDGSAVPGVEVELRHDDGTRCRPGEVGELYVRGPNTCVGFFRDPEREAATFSPDGWVRSGDLATMDGDGYVSIVGRKKEIIIRGGMNIAPREVEELIAAFPEVRRVAVVGVPDDRLGERACACVVLVEGATLGFEELVDRLRRSGLAAYKLPERLELLASLPSTASGKVQKHEILRVLDEQRQVAR